MGEECRQGHLMLSLFSSLQYSYNILQYSYNVLQYCYNILQYLQCYRSLCLEGCYSGSTTMLHKKTHRKQPRVRNYFHVKAFLLKKCKTECQKKTLLILESCHGWCTMKDLKGLRSPITGFVACVTGNLAGTLKLVQRLLLVELLFSCNAPLSTLLNFQSSIDVFRALHI